jgi:hypothetical protein
MWSMSEKSIMDASMYDGAEVGSEDITATLLENVRA